MIERSNKTKCYDMHEIKDFFINENKDIFMKYLNNKWTRCAVCQLIFADNIDKYAICSDECEEKGFKWCSLIIRSNKVKCYPIEAIEQFFLNKSFDKNFATYLNHNWTICNICGLYFEKTDGRTKCSPKCKKERVWDC